MMFETIKNDIEKRMASTTQSFKSDMQGIRAGRASPSMLDSIKVEAYGQKMNINQLGNITTPDSRTINVDIWDASNVGFVEKSLRESDLGINPLIEGNLIRLPLPQLTEERRVEFLKMAGKLSESSKVAIRNIRREANEDLKKLLKSKDIGEDEEKSHEKKVQTITDEHIKTVDDKVSYKEKEIMTI